MSKRDRKNKKNAANKSFSQDFDDDFVYIPPRNEERILIEKTSSLTASKVLCISTGRAQLAGFVADQNPEAKVVCHYLDSRHAFLANEYWKEADAPPEIFCAPDFPEDSFDAACIPVLQQGDAELNRELLQQAHQRLREGGTLFAAINNPTDKWLREQLEKLFPKVTREEQKTGTFYSARKNTPLKRVRNFHAEFPVKFLKHQMTFQTRPGVFSHRSIDDGTWALIKSLGITPGTNLLDLGCGSGAVGIAALLSAKDVKVTAIDSHARAIECTKLNAEKNLSSELLARLKVIHSHTSEKYTTGKFDFVAINPPYFQHLTIAEAFISAARKALKKEGRMLFVTKMPHWYEEYLPKFFRKVTITPCGDYSIVQGRQ